MKSNQPKATLRAIASYLPSNILSNADLEKMVDTSDEWIWSRTGIRERRIASQEETASFMGAQAALRLLAKIQMTADQVDLILVATMTPDQITPSTAVHIQRLLSADRAAAVDLQAACSGFLYGLSMAKAYIESGMYKNILLIGTEKMSAFLNFQDRNTCVLFGDGAAAVLISGSGPGFLIDPIELGADGNQAQLLEVPAGGSSEPACQDTIDRRRHYLTMEGRSLFKHAVRRMHAVCLSCLASSGTDLKQVSWIVPHQANIRILQSLAEAIDYPMQRVYTTLHKYGNTSASCLPIALEELLATHEVASGEKLLLVAFGAGLTWGAALLTKV